MTISRRGLFGLAAGAAVVGADVGASVNGQSWRIEPSDHVHNSDARFNGYRGDCFLCRSDREKGILRVSAQWTPQEIEILRKRGYDPVTAKLEI